MSKTYITSDLHFGHSNIIKYCPKSRGDLISVDEMNEQIITNINSKVSEDDTLILVGDLCFSSPMKGCEFLKRINGKKIIIWGNHDKKLRESTEFKAQRDLIGVIKECDYLEMAHVVDEIRHFICLMHYPLRFWNRMDHKSINLHGHCHSSFENRNTQGVGVRQMDIGLDGNYLFPHDLDEICREMSSRESKQSGHHN